MKHYDFQIDTIESRLRKKNTDHWATQRESVGKYKKKEKKPKQDRGKCKTHTMYNVDELFSCRTKTVHCL
jgi:hypothetical protein